MFDAVLFDLDETLILDEPVSKHAFFIAALELTSDEARANPLAAAAEHHAKALWKELPPPAAAYALRIGHSALEGLWAHYDANIPEEAALEEAMKRMRPEVWRRALAQCQLRGDEHALEKRWRSVRQQYPLFSDTDALLARLKPHTKLGIVTNGVAGLQRLKLEGSGLLPWFDAVAISGEVGIGKPEVGIFEWVAQQLGVSRARCLMVGDNPERDVQGGINAGMSTVWVDRGLKPPGPSASHHVKSLGEIWQWLQGASTHG
jgi:HAD superfamily hydrolase (TIGR01549 family)